ncbi:MAG: calcium-binding protein, partial [Bilophila sp.]
MADITLVRPAPGEHAVVENVADARLEFAFPADAATLERTGDNLVFTFDDGSTLTLNNFYTAYTKESLPDFIIEGETIPGTQFFAALGEDLQPAAGPAAATPAQGAGGRFQDYANAALIDGIDRLGGLDLGLNNAPQEDTTLNGLG